MSTAIVGLLCTLIGTGIISSISLYARVSTLTEAQTRTDQQLQRHLDNAVDLGSYRTRDAAIQKMLDSKAPETEVTELHLQLDKAMDKMATKDDVRDQLRALQTLQETIITRTGRTRP